MALWAALVADTATVGTLLLGVAALVTAISAAAVGQRNARTAKFEAQAAREAAQTGEDDSYVNRALLTMQESQKWLKEENIMLLAKVENQRLEIIGLHEELNELKPVKMKLLQCEEVCRTVSARLAAIEGRGTHE